MLFGSDCNFRKEAYTLVELEFGNVMFLMYKSDAKIRMSTKLAEVNFKIRSGSTKYDFLKKKNATAHPIHLMSVCKNKG